MNTWLPVQRVRPDAVLPEYKSTGAAGLDLSACLTKPLQIRPKEIVVIPTGVAVAIPSGFEGQVRLRSSASKLGLMMPHGVGTIDADYRGELVVVMYRLEVFGHDPNVPLLVFPGDRIGQLVVSPVAQVLLQLTTSLEETERGARGFGSTGT